MHPLPGAVDSKGAVLVRTYFTPTLLGMMAGRLPAASVVTHTLPLDRMEEAYDVFSRAGDTGALKVLLGGQQHDVLRVRTSWREE